MGKGFESTIFSSPIRGSGGDATYRGNCCPGIIEKFIEQYDMKYLSDYAIGSGTTVDVCNRKHVNGYWTDLRLGFDLVASVRTGCAVLSCGVQCPWHASRKFMKHDC